VIAAVMFSGKSGEGYIFFQEVSQVLGTLKPERQGEWRRRWNVDKQNKNKNTKHKNKNKRYLQKDFQLIVEGCAVSYSLPHLVHFYLQNKP
jgi:hypothetical protein